MIVGLAYIMFRLDINDFDTQFSSSIIDSKQNGFFVQRYDTLKGESSCVRISEAWVEHI